jgi:hypothetical protein
VSSAPQNDEPIQTLATSATIPRLVDESRTRSRAAVRVESAALGKSWRRSSRTLCSSSLLSSTRPAMKSASSASGKTDRSRL